MRENPPLLQNEFPNPIDQPGNPRLLAHPRETEFRPVASMTELQHGLASLWTCLLSTSHSKQSGEERSPRRTMAWISLLIDSSTVLVFWVLFCFVFLFFCFLNLLFIYLFLYIYFWLCWVFVSVRGLSLVAASGGYSSLRCVGFSLQWLLLLRSTGSRRTGFSSCGTRAQ